MTAIRKRAWTSANGEAKTAWLVDYRDQAGKRRSKQFARKKDAESWLVSAAWQVSQGTHTHDRDSVTVEEACKLWISAPRERPLERGTIQQYEQIARLHINPLLGGVRLSRLTAPMVEDFKDKLLESRTKPMAAKALQGLSSVLLEAQRRGLVAQNVARTVKVKRSSRHKPEIEIPTRHELKAILEHAPVDLKAMLMTTIVTGMRSSEIRGLPWCDVDLKGCTIKVSQRADKYGNIGPPKSKAGRRSIPIPPALANELREWRLQCPPGPLGLAFPNTQGGVQQYGHLLRRKFLPLQIRAGICDPVQLNGKTTMKARYGFHALRHAAASGWIAQKIDLKRLQVWMGHESIDLTIDTYGHLMDDAKEDARLADMASADLFI